MKFLNRNSLNHAALVILLLTTLGCQENTQEEQTIVYDLSQEYKIPIENLVNFFEENAYDTSLKTYFSELDNEGNKVSNKIYTVALSRLIYALAYTSQYYPEHLQKAEDAVQFQLNHMIGEDSIGKYFVSYVENEFADTSSNLDIWQQAYGLCGLTELYNNTEDANLLATIHELHDAFVKRFKDVENGGFFERYNTQKGQISGSKTLQSLMYPITAYMGNLYFVDSKNREKYAPIIRTHFALLDSIGFSKSTGWVNVKFDDTWNTCVNENAEQPCFTATPGHNFQLAALMLRAWDFFCFSEEEQFHYEKTGLDILKTTLANAAIFPAEGIKNGFYSEVYPNLNEVLDKRKTWWQHAEALIALSFAGFEFEQQKEDLELFYFENFMDYENGGEFFFLSCSY